MLTLFHGLPHAQVDVLMMLVGIAVEASEALTLRLLEGAGKGPQQIEHEGEVYEVTVRRIDPAG